MSRQRIRTGVLEGSTVVCAHCMGAGVVRSTASIALHVLRVLEDALIKSASHNMIVRTRTEVALYILNQKRAHLRDLERRFGVTVILAADDTLTGVNYHAFERGEPATGVRADDAVPEAPRLDYAMPSDEEIEDELRAGEESDTEAEEAASGEPSEEEAQGQSARQAPRGERPAAEEGEAGRRRRRRRRRRGERGPSEGFNPDAPQPTDSGLAVIAEIGGDLAIPASALDEAPEEGQALEEGRPRGVPGRARRARGPRRGDRGRGPRAPGFEAGEQPAGEAAEVSQATGGADEEAERPPIGDAEADGHAWSQVREAIVEGTDVEEAPPADAGAEDGAPAAASRATASAPSRQAEVEDPSRPKRSGWWRRARATFAGE
jgi:ribonuclease E